MVHGARVWTDPDKTRLVFETSAPVGHRLFPIDEPHRLVVDLDDARLMTELPKVDLSDALLVGLRSGPRGDQHLRVVLDLKQPVRAKSFVLSPNERYAHRLIIDLIPREGVVERRVALPTFPGAMPGRIGSRGDVPPAFVVAIDAGHGGEDPGAIGAAGTKEKDVTLAIARELARLVDQEPGMRAVMIRDGDYYVGLRERIEIAHEQQADLFISIHADAFSNPRARGSSVYTLSHSGASSASAKWLAKRENRADRFGGVEASKTSDLLETVLMDMTRNATLESSVDAAALVLTHLGRVNELHRSDVQRAGFVVLESPDIPSILVETAFISNLEEERRLRDRSHQRTLAQAIMAGVRVYARNYPARGVVVDASPRGLREVVIHAGDTLSGIAQRYQVSLRALREHNGLKNDVIRVGQVLSIPEDS